MDNETLTFYNMFRANSITIAFFVSRHFRRVDGKLDRCFVKMNLNLYSTSCVGTSLPVRISKGDIIKILINLNNVLEACIVGCYLDGLEK